MATSRPSLLFLAPPPTAAAMLEWGWRIPFMCAAATAVLGAALRRSMPEPKAFLKAARLQNLEAGRAAVDVEVSRDEVVSGTKVRGGPLRA